MEQAQGFVDKGKLDLASKIHTYIYGLKQAPRPWFIRLSNFLLDLDIDLAIHVVNTTQDFLNLQYMFTIGCCWDLQTNLLGLL